MVMCVNQSVYNSNTISHAAFRIEVLSLRPELLAAGCLLDLSPRFDPSVDLSKTTGLITATTLDFPTRALVGPYCLFSNPNSTQWTAAMSAPALPLCPWLFLSRSSMADRGVARAVR